MEEQGKGWASYDGVYFPLVAAADADKIDQAEHIDAPTDIEPSQHSSDEDQTDNGLRSIEFLPRDEGNARRSVESEEVGPNSEADDIEHREEYADDPEEHCGEQEAEDDAAGGATWRSVLHAILKGDATRIPDAKVRVANMLTTLDVWLENNPETGLYLTSQFIEKYCMPEMTKLVERYEPELMKLTTTDKIAEPKAQLDTDASLTEFTISQWDTTYLAQWERTFADGDSFAATVWQEAIMHRFKADQIRRAPQVAQTKKAKSKRAMPAPRLAEPIEEVWQSYDAEWVREMEDAADAVPCKTNSTATAPETTGQQSTTVSAEEFWDTGALKLPAMANVPSMIDPRTAPLMQPTMVGQHALLPRFAGFDPELLVRAGLGQFPFVPSHGHPLQAAMQIQASQENQRMLQQSNAPTGMLMQGHDSTYQVAPSYACPIANTGIAPHSTYGVESVVPRGALQPQLLPCEAEEMIETMLAEDLGPIGGQADPEGGSMEERDVLVGYPAAENLTAAAAAGTSELEGVAEVRSINPCQSDVPQPRGNPAQRKAARLAREAARARAASQSPDRSSRKGLSASERDEPGEDNDGQGKNQVDAIEAKEGAAAKTGRKRPTPSTTVDTERAKQDGARKTKAGATGGTQVTRRHAIGANVQVGEKRSKTGSGGPSAARGTGGMQAAAMETLLSTGSKQGNAAAKVKPSARANLSRGTANTTIVDKDGPVQKAPVPPTKADHAGKKGSTRSQAALIQSQPRGAPSTDQENTGAAVARKSQAKRQREPSSTRPALKASANVAGPPQPPSQVPCTDEEKLAQRRARANTASLAQLNR